MKTVKPLVTAFLLVFSSQSLALFMPDGYQTGKDTSTLSNDVGC